jgi:hypothetical protein
MRLLLPLALTGLLATPAAASSPSAWRQLQQQAERSCISASTLVRPRVSNMVVFDDATGVLALLVSGAPRQGKLKGTIGANLCLSDRKTKKASVEEAKGWSDRR